jgi:glutamine amidotransferase
MIAIIDYGMGNIHSVNKALQLYGAQTLVTNDPREISKSEKIVLPGVGAFDDAMHELGGRGLVSAIKKEVKSGKPLLGICLGMQLLFEESQEAKKAKGLGILKGTVRKFKETNGLKVPHMGWNQLKKSVSDCLLLRDISDGVFVYFCHSYYPRPQDKKQVAATTDYGIDFTSVVWKDNVYGVQFHPEKSQKIGLKIIENFLSLC